MENAQDDGYNIRHLLDHLPLHDWRWRSSRNHTRAAQRMEPMAHGAQRRKEITNLYYFEELSPDAKKMAVAFFQDQMRDDPIGYDLIQAE